MRASTNSSPGKAMMTIGGAEAESALDDSESDEKNETSDKPHSLDLGAKIQNAAKNVEHGCQ